MSKRLSGPKCPVMPAALQCYDGLQPDVLVTSSTARDPKRNAISLSRQAENGEVSVFMFVSANSQCWISSLPDTSATPV